MATFIGKRILRFETVTSTNDVAKEMAKSGEPEGTVIVADRQTAGKGRLGRNWVSRAGEGLWASIILRPAMSLERASLLTMATALAIRRVLEKDYSLKAAVKWPNDVLIKGRKVAGILAEAGYMPTEPYVILGFGVNTASKDDFPAFLSQVIGENSGKKPPVEPTSVAVEAGRVVLPGDLLEGILREFESRYFMLLTSGMEPGFLAEWREYDVVLGSDVIVNLLGDRQVRGKAIDVTGEGALLVDTLDYGRINVVAGDVWVRPTTSLACQCGDD